MKINRKQLFIDDPHARKILDEVIEYVSASFTNQNLWLIIKKLVEEENAKKLDYLNEKAKNLGISIDALPVEDQIMPYEYAEPQTFFSITLFLSLSVRRAKIEGGEDAQGSLHSVGEAFQLLIDANILCIPYAIFHRDAYRGSRLSDKNQAYRLNDSLAKYIITNNLLYNHLFGFNYIINKYTNSVVKIVVKNKDKTEIGTGWLLDIVTNNSKNSITRLVVTNDHVIAGASSISVLNKSDAVLDHSNPEQLLTRLNVDIALMQVPYDPAIPAFILHPNVPLLEEIVTIGYPKVPLTREAYQLVHRGEVNAQVKDYLSNQDLLVISARTAPGNSGSPVIDDTGRVVGMITEELFEKSAFEQKGIIPYSACIPAEAISNAIWQSDTVELLLS